MNEWELQLEQVVAQLLLDGTVAGSLKAVLIHPEVFRMLVSE